MSHESIVQPSHNGQRAADGVKPPALALPRSSLYRARPAFQPASCQPAACEPQL